MCDMTFCFSFFVIKDSKRRKIESEEKAKAERIWKIKDRLKKQYNLNDLKAILKYFHTFPLSQQNHFLFVEIHFLFSSFLDIFEVKQTITRETILFCRSHKIQFE
jgi:hypothetical protein